MMKRPGSFKGEGITLLELLAIVAVLAILSRAASLISPMSLSRAGWRRGLMALCVP